MEEGRKLREIEPKSNISPLAIFFKLGDKVTGKDPQRKANFDYYMLWVIFLAFLFVFAGNLWDFIDKGNWASLGWSAFGLAIMWFQYFNLKNMYQFRKMRENVKIVDENKIEGPDEMLAGFQK